MSEVIKENLSVKSGVMSKIRIVPHWIFKAAILNRLNTIELTDYTKLTGFLSLDDMAEWLYLNESFSLGSIKATDLCIYNLLDNLDDQALRNIRKMTQMYRDNEDNMLAIVNRLRYTNSSDVNDEFRDKESVYKFIHTPTHILLVLNEGFIDEMKSSDFEYTFMRNCLKELYKTDSITSINNQYSVLYKNYLRILSLS